MTWSAYGSFLLCVLALVVVPGPDFAVVTKNTVGFGRRRGTWCAAGVTSANAVQGAAAAGGVGVVVARAQPALEWLKWSGVVYLFYLGVRAVHSAVRARYEPLDGAGNGAAGRFGGWREGFLTNITNPKVLTFYLAVLPQFVPPGAGLGLLLLLAAQHCLLLLLYLSALVLSVHRVRRLLTRRRVRRALDTATGAALLGCGLRLAAG